jgi:hypothetical protein
LFFELRIRRYEFSKFNTFAVISEKEKAAGTFPTEAHLASDANGRAGVADWALTRHGGAELVTGEADGRGPAVSGFDKKGGLFCPGRT